MKKKTLLVDDEPGILRVLGISLADRGYEVFTAESGEEALAILEKTGPEIVLTDIKMPGMDGIQLLRRIKEARSETQVIMITGHGDMELAIQSLKHEASDFITKPIHDEALDIALKRACEKIAVRNELKEHTQNLERLVEEKTSKLIESERLAAVGQTVAGLSHAIKNITSGLTGGMYVLEKGIEMDNRTYLCQGWEMIKGNMGKIKAMTLDLLNYAKEREPAYELCDPNLPVRQVVELMQSRATECGVSLESELSLELPRVVMDPEGIHRVLLNLVTNAIDACADLSCTKKNRRVVVRAAGKENWAVEYQVIDDGCGMDEEARGKAFQRFFSTKGSRGTGLGLMIAKKIVDEHLGAIEFLSEQGKGTTFFVRLPGKESVAA